MAGGFVENQGCLATEQEMAAWFRKKTLKGGEKE